MFEDEMPESDSSDEDFVPTGEGSEVSEEDSDSALPEDEDAQTHNLTKKRKNVKSSMVNRKKKKKEVEEEPLVEDEKTEQPKEEENPEERKKKADALWADFLKDCGPVVKKKAEMPQSRALVQLEAAKAQEPTKDGSKTEGTSDRLQTQALSEHSKSSDKIEGSSKTDDKVVEVYEFAGEKVVVEKKVDPRRRPVSQGGGAAAFLSQLNKKSKLSTLEKSKLDWESFKNKEGINEQLSAHNRGKNGYLEKQDFLERADLRQFEIEKQMRAYSRSKRV